MYVLHKFLQYNASIYTLAAIIVPDIHMTITVPERVRKGHDLRSLVFYINIYRRNRAFITMMPGFKVLYSQRCCGHWLDIYVLATIVPHTSYENSNTSVSQALM